MHATDIHLHTEHRLQERDILSIHIWVMAIHCQALRVSLHGSDIDGDIDEFTDMVWENLNEDNKVSLFVRYIDIATGEYESRIVNKNK